MTFWKRQIYSDKKKKNSGCHGFLEWDGRDGQMKYRGTSDMEHYVICHIVETVEWHSTERILM